MHDFPPELTNLMRSGRINRKPLRMCDFHFMGCQLSPYASKHNQTRFTLPTLRVLCLTASWRKESLPRLAVWEPPLCPK